MGTLKQAVDRVAAAKTAIGNAITAKGGTVASGDGLEEFAADIATITNQYTAADEGKVVSSGQLVAQTAYPTTITENGTYNTTENNSVTVNVAGATTEEVTIDDTRFTNQKIFILYDTSIGIYGSCNISNLTPPGTLTMTYTSDNDLSTLLNKIIYFGSYQHGGKYTITAINSSTKKITLTKGTAMSTFATNPYAVTTLDS